jgi:hypothetical protein
MDTSQKLSLFHGFWERKDWHQADYQRVSIGLKKYIIFSHSSRALPHLSSHKPQQLDARIRMNVGSSTHHEAA